MTATKRDDPERIVQLCKELEEATQLKDKGKARKFVNTISNTSQPIASWKFQEWSYGKDNIKLPINARGLFTINDDTIVVRGYDKFFNMGEMSLTKPEALKANTSGPYDVTLKENGCIIFVGGLSTGELVVCSKHSTGPRDDLTTNHALEGEAQVARQLQKAGKSAEKLAKYLHEHNLTAVAELCDDSFEEHVLPYSKEEAGLYLHGLNYNIVEFSTVPIEEVDKFAAEWGFHTVNSFRYDDFDALQEFFDECAKTGTYKGREVEGFVIRCKNADKKDFFFKYKFEQPYLLYRQFREVTKSFISSEKPVSSIRIKRNKYITRQYLHFVDKLFKENPHMKSDFLNGKGIIKTRELFLEHINEPSGINLLNIDALHESMEKLDISSKDSETKYVIIPVATISCGKTTVFQTLHNLFPEWPHVQNDNISRSSKAKLADQAIKALQESSVVLVDRNNSEYRERSQIINDIQAKSTKSLDDVNFEFICVNFIADGLSESELWDITFERTKIRGDNHQSIKSKSNENLAISVMKGFIRRFQPVNTTVKPDSLFDLVIDLKLNRQDSSKDNVKTIIEKLRAKYPTIIEKTPSEGDIEAAFQEALRYKPAYEKVMQKGKSPTYFGVSINETSLLSCIQQTVGEHQQWKELQEIGRVQKEFHVTLGHSNTPANDKEMKQKWKDLVKTLPSKYNYEKKTMLPVYADVELRNIVIAPDRLICVDVIVSSVYDAEEKPVTVEPLNKHLHITLGTFAPSIWPMESNSILNQIFGGAEALVPGKYADATDDVEVVGAAVMLLRQQIFAFYS